MKYFSSDWHFGHSNIIKYSSRPFKTVEDMNNTLLHNITTPLKPGDVLYFLGDFAMSNKQLIHELLTSIPKHVAFHWILGNHDLKYYKQFASYVSSISSLKEIKIAGNHVTLCHYPMLTWNKSHYNSWMLYGHHHKGEHLMGTLSAKVKGKMLNVNCEFNNFELWSEEDVIKYMDEQNNNWNYIGEIK